MIAYLLAWAAILCIVTIDFLKAQENLNETPQTRKTWGKKTYRVMFYSIFNFLHFPHVAKKKKVTILYFLEKLLYFALPHACFALFSLYWGHVIYNFTLVSKRIEKEEMNKYRGKSIDPTLNRPISIDPSLAYNDSMMQVPVQIELQKRDFKKSKNKDNENNDKNHKKKHKISHVM